MNKKTVIALIVFIVVLSILRAIVLPSPRFTPNRDKENAYTEYLKKNNIEQKGN
ncbi:hypothetical protein [Pseudobutyrivibrio xylanivorans]|uniref:hypothetical protein n=1 Tax=Pseudobutyrivibrio xylanivorans TaxID=185007 RepID=UPI00142EEF14|nr:hypothetical protein [Pseudobutyrivibrio xylanivorans]